jgi:Predicted esterase
MAANDNEVSLHSIAVTRTGRYAVLGSATPRLREVWVVCHGYAQLAARFIERFRPIADASRLFVAPEALSRFYPSSATGAHGPASQVGASWMTSEDRENEIRDYVGYLDRLYDELFKTIDRNAVSVCALGFSQGASTIARWVAAGNSPVDRVVLWAGSLPTELNRTQAERLSTGSSSLIVVAGTEDRFITPKVLDAQLASLAELGVHAEVVRFPGGHEVEASTLKEVAAKISR